MYYFMIRPFALGDDITYNGTRYTVKSMTLLSVELVRYDGTSVTVSTTELRKTHVQNLTRSRETQLELRFMVHDLHRKIPQLLKTVSKCVRQCTRLHKRLFHGPFNVWLSQTGSDMFVCVAFELRNKGVWVSCDAGMVLQCIPSIYAHVKVQCWCIPMHMIITK